MQRLTAREIDTIDLVVIHCTELPDMAMARRFGERIVHQESQTGNSGHFYIDRDGSIEQWVPLERVAHHVRSHNLHSIGIELVNNGRYPDWFDSTRQRMTEPYPATLLSSLVRLLDDLTGYLPGLRYIAGHEDLDSDLVASTDRPATRVRRKLDPGPCFPWQEILDNTPLRKRTGRGQ